MIVSTGSNAVIGTDLESALAQLFPGFEEPIGDRVPDSGDDTESPTTGEPDEETSGDESTTEQTSERRRESAVDNGDRATGEPDGARRCSTRPQELFAQAEELLRTGDLGGYQETIDARQGQGRGSDRRPRRLTLELSAPDVD